MHNRAAWGLGQDCGRVAAAHFPRPSHNTTIFPAFLANRSLARILLRMLVSGPKYEQSDTS